MKDFTESLKKSLDDKNWYAALFIALSLPDICGKIDNPGEKSSQKRYAAWFKEYIEHKYKYDPLQESTREEFPGVIRGQIYGTLPNPSGKPETFLSGLDCYALRCAFLHDGSENISGQTAQERIESFEFITPDILPDGSIGPWIAHCNMDGKRNVLQLQVDIFCQDILDGVEDWISAKNPTISPSLKIFDRGSGLNYRFPPEENWTQEKWINYLKTLKH